MFARNIIYTEHDFISNPEALQNFIRIRLVIKVGIFCNILLKVWVSADPFELVMLPPGCRTIKMLLLEQREGAEVFGSQLSGVV